MPHCRQNTPAKITRLKADNARPAQAGGKAWPMAGWLSVTQLDNTHHAAQCQAPAAGPSSTIKPSSSMLGGSPHVTTSNLILRPGKTPAAELEKLDRGLYVTDLMGFGFNAVTGDYSQGAAGFWIEKGERAYPVSEITISSNFDDLLKNIDAIGDDLDTRSSTQTASFRVSKVTVAGT